MKKYFEVNVNKYSTNHNFNVHCVSTLKNPKSNAVTFITKNNIPLCNVFKMCRDCLIFWPEDYEVPETICGQGHVFLKCNNPHLRYCQFFEENKIVNLPDNSEVELVNGSFISKNAVIGRGTVVFPGAYIGGETVIGEDCFIGSGVRIVGEVNIGDRVVIRENTVIGADGLTTDRDETGKPVHMPQFGGVRICDDVNIGANSVIARGAIDDTVIGEKSSIDNSTFISHNVSIGKQSFVVGETIMFGSSSLGDNAFISGNATIRNGVSVGDRSLVGMGAVVVRDVPEGTTVKGNPAK